VEVEAYGGPEDRASHARFGSTARNAVMAGPAGIAYVYLVYGMYDCLNVVTGSDGIASAVLIRAVEPLVGVDAMRASRLAVAGRRRAVREGAREPGVQARLAGTPDRRLASGPGLVGACFGVDPGWTGMDLCDPASPLRLERDPAAPGGAAPGGADPAVAIASGPRIGIGYAGEPWTSRPWRFWIEGHPSVSRRR
jgi:DNA-3-methyladenine glycosylase